MVNTCIGCKQSQEVAAVVGALNSSVETLSTKMDTAWQQAITLNELAGAITAPDSDATVAAQADIDQEQEYVLDTTARRTRIGEEICQLVGTTLKATDQIVCSDEKTETCPKLMRIAAMFKPFQQLNKEFSDPN